MKISGRQLANRYLTAILRNIPYPVTHAIRHFDPVGGGGPNRLVVLCDSRRFLEGCWSLWSWHRHIHALVSPMLLVDGAVQPQNQRFFRRLFPTGTLLDLAELLSAHTLPRGLDAFVNTNWTGRKLAALHILQLGHSVLYADCDVVAFRDPNRIISLIASNSCPAYMDDPAGYALDPWLGERAGELGISITPHFNAGFMWLPRGTLPAGFIEELLHSWKPADNTHHSEQTACSILLSARGAVPLPRDEYVLSWTGVWAWERDIPCESMIARHYTGPTRHRMYLTAYPWLFRDNSCSRWHQPKHPEAPCN
jgi:hypothetical protein